MQKDLIDTQAPNEAETQFVERYWTENWKRHGGVEGRVAQYDKSLDKLKWRTEWRMMKPVFEALPADAKILDGGCGTGEWCRFLAQRGHHVTGLDISQETVVELQKIFPDASFLQGDIRSTGFAAGSIDLYYSWGTFEHFESGVGDCVSEALRIMRPGGYLFITVPYDRPGLAIRRTFDNGISRSATGKLRFYQWRFTRREIADELRNHGFDVRAMKPIHRRQTVVRWLNRSLGMSYNGRVGRVIGLLFGILLPRAFSGHMLLAVARKPD